MLYIALSLFGGWILSLFGFDAVVMAGMLELFGKTISTTGYYFLFGLLGALKSLFRYFREQPTIEFTPKGKVKKK